MTSLYNWQNLLLSRAFITFALQSQFKVLLFKQSFVLKFITRSRGDHNHHYRPDEADGIGHRKDQKVSFEIRLKAAMS